MKNPDMKWFRVDLNPVPWAVGPLQVIKRNGKFIAIMGRNQELYTYQQAIKDALKEQLLLNEIEPPFRLRVFFWRRIDTYTTHQARAAYSHEADTTNMVKAIEDALQGIFYKNDKTNIAVEGYIVRQDDEVDEGHIIVGIEEVALDYPYNQLVGVPEELINPPKPGLSEEDEKWRTSSVDF